MFQVITVSSSPERSHVVRHLVHATGQLMPLRELEAPVDEVAVQRALALHHPDALIVDLEGGEESAIAAYYLRKHGLGVPMIGLGGSEELRASVADIGFGAFTSARPEAAELLAPLEAEDVRVRPVRRKGPACQRMNPGHWPQRR